MGNFPYEIYHSATHFSHFLGNHSNATLFSNSLEEYHCFFAKVDVN